MLALLASTASIFFSHLFFCRKIDTDANGEISYDEFKTFWADEDRMIHMMLSPEQQSQVQSLFECFAYFDDSQNGKLELNEFENLFQMMKERGFQLRGSPKKAFKEIDINGDGSVEFAELLRFFIEKYGILETSDAE